MNPESNDPGWMYGKSIDDPRVRAFLQAVSSETSIEPQDDQLFWSSRESGLTIEVDPSSRRVKVIHLYSGRTSGKSRYQYMLPHGITFDMARSEVVAAVGAPLISGPKHDGWDTGDHRLSVEYGQGGEIKKIGIFG